MRSKFVFIFILIVNFSIISSCNNDQAVEGFSFSPEKPQPGDSISIVYNPIDTELEEASSIEMVAYLFSKGRPTAIGVSMKHRGRLWRGSFSTGDATKGVILKFESNEKIDNNQSEGYIIMLTDEEGNTITGGKAALGEALGGQVARLVNIDENPDLALSYMEEDIKLHPELKREYLSPYLGLIQKVNKETGKEVILNELEKLSSSPNLTSDDVNVLRNWYKRLEMPDLFRKFNSMLREVDPEHANIQAEDASKSYDREDIEEKLTLMEIFKENYSEDAWMYTGFMFIGDIVRAYSREGEYDKAIEFLEKNPVGTRYHTYSNLATEMFEKGIDLSSAEKHQKKPLKYMNMNLKINCE